MNIKNFDPNNIKMDEKSDKIILIYYIRYITIKYVKVNSVNLILYFQQSEWIL